MAVLEERTTLPVELLQALKPGATWIDGGASKPRCSWAPGAAVDTTPGQRGRFGPWADRVHPPPAWSPRRRCPRAAPGRTGRPEPRAPEAARHKLRDQRWTVATSRGAAGGRRHLGPRGAAGPLYGPERALDVAQKPCRGQTCATWRRGSRSVGCRVSAGWGFTSASRPGRFLRLPQRASACPGPRAPTLPSTPRPVRGTHRSSPSRSRPQLPGAALRLR